MSCGGPLQTMLQQEFRRRAHDPAGRPRPRDPAATHDRNGQVRALSAVRPRARSSHSLLPRPIIGRATKGGAGEGHQVRRRAGHATRQSSAAPRSPPLTAGRDADLYGDLSRPPGVPIARPLPRRVRERRVHDRGRAADPLGARKLEHEITPRSRRPSSSCRHGRPHLLENLSETEARRVRPSRATAHTRTRSSFRGLSELRSELSSALLDCHFGLGVVT